MNWKHILIEKCSLVQFVDWQCRNIFQINSFPLVFISYFFSRVKVVFIYLKWNKIEWPKFIWFDSSLPRCSIAFNWTQLKMTTIRNLCSYNFIHSGLFCDTLKIEKRKDLRDNIHCQLTTDSQCSAKIEIKNYLKTFRMIVYVNKSQNEIQESRMFCHFPWKKKCKNMNHRQTTHVRNIIAR